MNSFLLAQKDLTSYFRSWLGFLIFVFFFLVAGIFFSFLVLSYSRISVEAARNAYENMQGLKLTHFVFSSFFLNMNILLMFLIPLVSMRAFAEERRQQTLELLFTYPLSDFDIVWGKFLALAGFLFLLMLPTASYLILLHAFGSKIDWGPVLLGYSGFYLLASAYLALGLFVSSLTDNQIISAIVTFGSLIFFWVLDWMAGIFPGPWESWIAALCPLEHYRDFALGIVDLSHLVYYGFFILYFLFLTLRSIETRNWKG